MKPTRPNPAPTAPRPGTSIPSRASHRAAAAWLAALAWLLAATSPARADITLVPKGSVWKYLDNGTDQGTAWRAPGFSDATWAFGPAQLGYGDGDEATTVGFGPNSSTKYITTYFRRAFTVADPTLFTGLGLSVLRDDGVVVYLNGTEVYRNNLPTGTITASTLAPVAVGGTEETTTFLTATLGTGTLLAGNNVLAVEIHQQSGTSSDISFDLELMGIQPGLPNVTRGPYLQNVTPDAITLRWRTSVNSDSRVRYGTSADNLAATAASATLKTEHEIRLTGLAPDTLYYYAIGNSEADLASGVDYFFYTAPPAGTDQPLRFWVLGDAGTASAGQVAVRNAYQNFNGTRYTDLILLLGDNAYSNGTDTEYQTKLFDIYPAAFRATPVFSTIGNHDTASLTNPNLNTTPYFLIFNHPTAAEGGGVASGTERYYSFNYGNVHFVCLDSMTSDKTSAGPMLTWLQQDLAQNTADWLVAFFHHPPYSKGSHDSDTEAFLVQMRQNALPILESYGVDLVLCGHSHSYERSFLLNGHYGLSTTLTSAMKLGAGSGREDDTGAYAKAGVGPNPNQGAVYVVPGSAGQISGGTLNHPAMFVSLNVLGSFVIDVNNTRLDARFITDTGTTNDWFTLVKGPQGNQPPSVSISSPTTGSGFNTGEAILVAATALDSDGSVAQVDFFANGSPVGSDTTAPFGVSWTPGTAGSYALIARATDNLGAQATSAAVNVTVADAPLPPAAPANLAASAA
ncbi:MAG: metallophosphoesterase, partial [Verrucomicrobiota bacterium]